MIIIILSTNRKPYHLDYLHHEKISLQFLTSLYAHFQNQIEPATYFTGSSWNLLWKLTTLMTNMTLLCSIKLLTYKYLMQTYLLLSRPATFRRHFGITKEKQGLYTTLQGLAYLRYMMLIHVRCSIFNAGWSM